MVYQTNGLHDSDSKHPQVIPKIKENKHIGSKSSIPAAEMLKKEHCSQFTAIIFFSIVFTYVADF